MNLTLGYLYSDLMNIYGDSGNVITLKKRGEWRQIDLTIKLISMGDNINPREIDLYFFGGGQDQQQEKVAEDLFTSGKAKALQTDIERGVPMLSICGGYQLLGEYYQPQKGKRLEGLNILPVFTEAGEKRMIGNIVVEVNTRMISLLGSNKLVGFENHSGKTTLKEGAEPLGKVVRGFGNNGQDKTEGCIYKNAIGCYMHGSLLPKNPQLADWLLTRAIEVKQGGEAFRLPELDDSIENLAHRAILTKFS